jgi:ATP-dependent Lhr-like helicase
MRFLFHWHGLGEQLASGLPALQAALCRLLGFPAAIAAWEGSLLPARVRDYQPAVLDQLLTGGEFLWTRPTSEVAGSQQRLGPIRTTPIAFLDRQQLDLWQALLPQVPLPVPGEGSEAARQIHAVLAANGAQFFTDLLRLTGLARNSIVAGLRELIAGGLISGDGYAGLRTLVLPAAVRSRVPEHRVSLAQQLSGKARPRPTRPGMSNGDPQGRWSLVATGTGPGVRERAADARQRDAIEHVALILLERYGVVFRSALQREARFLPPWRELAHALRRLEARGEIRGGRFIAGFGGEQFAWPEAVEQLREARHAGNQEYEIILSAVDPLNLSGIVTPGERVPAVLRNRILYRNGIPAGAWLRDEFVPLVPGRAAHAPLFGTGVDSGS